MESKDIGTHVFTKLTSGRWIFTVASAAVFVTLSVTGKLPPDDVKELLMLIATFYFVQRSVEKHKEP